MELTAVHWALLNLIKMFWFLSECKGLNSNLYQNSNIVPAHYAINGGSRTSACSLKAVNHLQVICHAS